MNNDAKIRLIHPDADVRSFTGASRSLMISEEEKRGMDFLSKIDGGQTSAYGKLMARNSLREEVTVPRNSWSATPTMSREGDALRRFREGQMQKREDLPKTSFGSFLKGFILGKISEHNSPSIS